jgi:hypothetical protein
MEEEAPTPSWNLKCIVFTLVLAMGYWFSPPRNKWVLLMLLYAPYAAMAWYDDYYNCQRDRFKPTFLSLFYGWLKPADYREKLRAFKAASPEWYAIIWIVDLLLLILILAITPSFLRWQPQ